MSLVPNERTKLLANALDRASIACFALGVFHLLAQWVLRKLRMIDLWTFAFVVMPAIVVAIGFGAVYLHGRLVP